MQVWQGPGSKKWFLPLFLAVNRWRSGSRGYLAETTPGFCQWFLPDTESDVLFGISATAA